VLRLIDVPHLDETTVRVLAQIAVDDRHAAVAPLCTAPLGLQLV